MRTFRIPLSMLFLAISLVGCASIGSSPGRTPFTQLDGDFPSTRIASVVIQDDIVARGEGASAGVIESIRSKINQEPKQDEAIVAPVRDALAGVDVRAELARELDAYGRKGLPFPITEVESRTQPITDPASRLQSLDEGGLLILATEYFFTPDYTALRVETAASLMTKEAVANTRSNKARNAKEERGRNKPVYANQILVHWEVPVENREDPLSFWLASNGKNVQKALREALRESARLLVWDLNDPNGTRENKIKAQSFTIANPDGEGSTRVRGVLVMETIKRYIIRLKGGQLLSMPNPKPEPAPRGAPNA